MPSDDLCYVPEDSTYTAREIPWVILIVDDDQEVHSFTKLGLKNFSYDNRELKFVSAFSSSEAISTFKARTDIAIVLLDVVMETDHAGLDLVKIIREDFNNHMVRIIIRTGQPGMAPARYVIDHYDINDYQEKTEVSADRLYITIRSSLAQYKQLMKLDENSLALSHEKRLLRTIIDTAPIRIFWKDEEGKYLGCNQVFLNDAHLANEDEIIGKTDFDMVWKEDAERFREDDRRVRQSGVSELNFLERQPQNDGKYLMLLTSKVPLIDQTGKTIGILGLYQDITEEYETKEALKEKEDFLLVQSRQAAMGELLSMIAHQWRQPLSNISMMVNTLQLQQIMGPKTPEETNKQLDSITSQIQYLSQTITDFRNFFKKDKEKQLVQASDIVKHSVMLIGKLLEDSNITLRLSLLCSKPFYTFPNELQHVFINLIKNAADALLEKDGVDKWIQIECEDKGDFIAFLVSDNGGGIDNVWIHRIFEPYFSTKHEKNGTGLGLYMSKTIIEKHLKGTLYCTNTAFGAQFTVALPYDFD